MGTLIIADLDSALRDCAGLIGDSPVMRNVKDLIRRFAPMNTTVLITGETGTGKELAARLLHRLSSRAKAPLIRINCAAIPDSLLESELFGHESRTFPRAASEIPAASGGTLFLDEIGDMSLFGQSKLLRVIEQSEIRALGRADAGVTDVRLIAATNCKLEQLVALEKFRKDLFYRINVARIYLPLLRERMEDVPALAGRFLADFSSCNGRRIESITKDAMRLLMQYDWPGNVRELRNTIETAVVLCRSDAIEPDDLQLPSIPGRASNRLNSKLDPESIPEGPEIDRLVHALQATQWNVTRAARALCWSRMTLYRKLAKYGMVRHAGEYRRVADDGGWTNTMDASGPARNFIAQH